MESWLEWGTHLILVLQAGGGPAIVQVMQAFTFLGAELFYMLVMPAVLWCFSSTLGVRLGLLLLTSASLNTVLKLALAQPRPFWVDSRVRALSVETSFGLPSGHAQNAVVLWGYLAYYVRRWWATLAAVLLILAISFSRIYLGVHFPSDIVAGWLIGGLLLGLFVVLERPIARWLKQVRLSTRLLAAAGLPLVLLALAWAAAQLSAEKTLPTEWADNFHLALGSAVPFRPSSLEDILGGVGALLGFAVGAVLLDDWGRFRGGRRGWAQAARFLVGLIGVIFLQFGLSAVLPEGEVFRFVRYALLGFWIAYGGPRAFVALGLA